VLNEKQVTGKGRATFPVASLLLLFLFTQNEAAAREVIFSQERLAFDSAGNPHPWTRIDPKTISGMKEHRFDLEKGRALVVRTNVRDAISRGLHQVAGTVRQCYAFIDRETGRTLTRDTLLYLLEFEEVPEFYRFDATYSGEHRWGEVRLTLIRSGEPLVGPGASAALTELLFDTLPHELGHDILNGIPSLLGVTHEQTPPYKRWFEEGVCELLAKRFAEQAAPLLWKKYLSMRRVVSVLDEFSVRSRIFHWSVENPYSMQMESDLYGASMLLMMVWTEAMGLERLLDRLDRPSETFSGLELIRMMEAATGSNSGQLLERASGFGKKLTERAARRALLLDGDP